MKKDIDAQFLCKDCGRYDLCEYYHNRKEDSYICKYFHLSEGRLIDADVLLNRIFRKAKTPSLSEDTVNGLCGTTAIIYDMLIESGQEKDADKESD